MRIKNSLLIFFFPVFIFTNQNIFNWESMTSLINVNSITQDSNGNIIGATGGGIIKLDNKIELIKDNLSNLNLSLVNIDNKGFIWAVSNSLNSSIHVFDSNYNLIYDSIYSLPDLESIIDFEFGESKVFAIYKDMEY